MLAEIPNGIKKCCSACFTRISRKISHLTSGTNSPAASSGGVSSSSKGAKMEGWSDDEVETVKRELRNCGRNWAAIAGKLASSSSAKTPEQCKKFFYDFRKKFGLDKIVLEYKRVIIT